MHPWSDPLAEADHYLVELPRGATCAEAVYDSLTQDDNFAAWADVQACDTFPQFRKLVSDGDFVAACALAENELLPSLTKAARSGLTNRGATPAEIRERNGEAFRTIATVPRDCVMGWLGGNGGAQVLRRPSPTRSRRRGSGLGRRPRSRRTRTVARARSPGTGDDGPEGRGDGDEPSPVLLRAIRHLKVGIEAVLWNRRCTYFAYAIDGVHPVAVGRAGFRGLCPRCRDGIRR
jgi:hypothetical protein